MRNSNTTAAVGLMMVLCLSPTLRAEETAPLDLADSPPKRYVVVKGDTLWGISKRYLKSPWRWPELWGMNKAEVRNPHLIYPGNVLILDLSGNTPKLRIEGEGGLAAAAGNSAVGDTVKLSPRLRVGAANAVALSSISPAAVEPFINRPLIVDVSQFESAPRVVATAENRVISSAGDSVYVRGITDGNSTRWQIYRPGKSIVDPITREPLGVEAVYLGEAQLREFAEDISTVNILRATMEINTGDRLVTAQAPESINYVPRSPPRDLQGLLVATTDTVLAEIGQRQVVVLNVGTRNGVEAGQVFALFRSGPTVVPRALPRSTTNEDARRSVRSVYKELDEKGKTAPVKLPDTRYGLVFVFRTFEKLSYALVMEASQSVNLLDLVRAP